MTGTASSPDAVYAAIECYNSALAEDAKSSEGEHLDAAERPTFGTPQHQEWWHNLFDYGETAARARETLCATAPTTVAGAVALAAYVAEMCARAGDEGLSFCDDPAAEILAMLAKAIPYLA